VISIDDLFGRQYDRSVYNCVHFVCEAWALITGDDLSVRAAGVLHALTAGGLQRRDISVFERLVRPIPPCIVLFNGRNVSPHVGLFYRQKVLHITEQGVQYMPLHVAKIGFDRVSFYR
jgi:hypothetical protein